MKKRIMKNRRHRLGNRNRLWSESARHSIPFGSDTISASDPQADISIGREEKAKRCLVGFSATSRRTFRKYFFENAVHLAGSGPKPNCWASNVSRNYSRKQKHEECFFSSLLFTSARRARTKRNPKMPLPRRTQPQSGRAISDTFLFRPSRSAIVQES